MDSVRDAQAQTNSLSQNINSAVQRIRDAYQSNAPSNNSESSSRHSRPLIFTESPCFTKAPSFSSLPFTPNFWNLAIGIDRHLSDVGIDYETEEIENETAGRHLLESMRMEEVEVLDTVSGPEPPNYNTSTRPGTLLPPPLEMPQRPSTVSKMKDNVNFNISEWFDDDDTAVLSPIVSQFADTPVPYGDSSVDMLRSDITRDKFDPAVSFEEYSILSQSKELMSTSKSISLPGKRGYQAPPNSSGRTCFGLAGPQELDNRGADYSDGFRNAFKARGEGLFHPTISDTVHDEEFAAFAAGGKGANRQFKEIGQEFELRRAAAVASLSPSCISGLQAIELSLASQKTHGFTRAGQIYVAHILQQNPGLVGATEEAKHSYTEEEIEWARNYLPNDVKIWMKRSCGMVGADILTLKLLDKALEKAAVESELVVNHTAVPSSQWPQEQLSKATVDQLNYWAEHEELMSLSELDMKWDAFETRLPAQTIPDGLQTISAPKDANPTPTAASLASARGFATVEDDEMTMIPTSATPNLFTDTSNKSPLDTLSKTFSLKAGAMPSGDLSLAPIVNKLSEILDSTEERATGRVPKEVEINSIGDSVDDGSQGVRMAEEEAHSNEMERLIEQYDYGLYWCSSQTFDNGFGIGESPPAPINVQEPASKHFKPDHPKESDAQAKQENTGLSARPRSVPDAEEVPPGHNSPMSISGHGRPAAEGHNSPMGICDDEQVAGDHNSPMDISDDEQVFYADQPTRKVSITGFKATGENESQRQHDTEDIIQLQRETSAFPRTGTVSTSRIQLIHSNIKSDLGTQQSVGKDILQTPKGITFPSKVSVPSPGLTVSSFSDSATISGTPSFTCIKCNKAYKKKAYLLKHEANSDCKPKNPKHPRVSVLGGIPTVKLSMTDQELIENGLPSVKATNWRHFPSCTACGLEFSTVGRLRHHILQSCPVLRRGGVYNKPPNQQLAASDQALALELHKPTSTGYFLMDEEESETDNSRSFSRSDLVTLKDSLSLSNTPINAVGADKYFAPNTIDGPRLGSAIKQALFPVSLSSPDPIKFHKENNGAEKTLGIRRLPGQVIQLTSQQVTQFNLPLLSDTDLLVMEEISIGEKVYNADSMVEIPALRQSYDPSPLKSASPALIRSTARSQNIEGSQIGQTPTPKLGRGTPALKDSIDSLQAASKQDDTSGDPRLPRMRGGISDEDEKPGLKYPARMRLFSEELALSSPYKSDPLEPFEDLPQNLMKISGKHSGGVLPSATRSTPHSTPATKDLLGNPASVFFSFANERLYAIAIQRLEVLIRGSIDPTLQSLRIWPSFSIGSSPSNSTFDFKVTAPEKVDLVTTLCELFPKMPPRMRGGHVIFVGEAITASSPSSSAALTPSFIEAPISMAVKTNRLKEMQKSAVEQQRRSSRSSNGAPELASQINLKTKVEDGSQDSEEGKRRRSSSRLAEMQAEQEKPIPAEKKRRKMNN